ncbi:hypothetical protein CspHIS471_0302080 [Cutaneotrichosporon sp. HIS471]|nr:hypothetical protein CspHIS471_0302080 [Cutaneotrichosporon sp. HIS471]
MGVSDASRGRHDRSPQESEAGLVPHGARHRPTSSKDKVREFLVVFAEEFDLSPDLGQLEKGYARTKDGYRNRKRKACEAADEFFASQRPIKNT